MTKLHSNQTGRREIDFRSKSKALSIYLEVRIFQVKTLKSILDEVEKKYYQLTERR